MQRVERVEELLLRGIAPRDELNVVEHQHVHVAEALAELDVLVVLDGGNQLVGEHLAGQIEQAQARKVILNEVTDGVHEVRLAQTHAAVEEQRVVGRARRLRDGQRGRVRKPVRGADDERVERRFGVERVDARHLREAFLLLPGLPFHALRDAHQLDLHLAPGRLAHCAGDHRQIARADVVLHVVADDLQGERVVLHIDRLERLLNPCREGDGGDLLAQQRLGLFPQFYMIH